MITDQTEIVKTVVRYLFTKSLRYRILSYKLTVCRSLSALSRLFCHVFGQKVVLFNSNWWQFYFIFIQQLNCNCWLATVHDTTFHMGSFIYQSWKHSMTVTLCTYEHVLYPLLSILTVTWDNCPSLTTLCCNIQSCNAKGLQNKISLQPEPSLSQMN